MAEPPSLEPSLGPLSFTSLSNCTYDSSSGSDGSCPYRGKIEGYDYEFVPPADSRYECAICLLVLREPRQTPCGHRFCRDCILKWLRESQPRCPVDNEKLKESDLFPDNFAKREINNFMAKCPNAKQGCNILTTVREMAGHLNECKLALIPCPNRCTNVLLRQDVDNHLQNTCEQRLLRCPNCHLNKKAVEYQSHLESCPLAQVKCLFCNLEIVRQMLETHHEHECPKVIRACSFSALGCDVKMERCQEKAHLDDSLQMHMALLCHGITTIMQFLGISRLPLDGVSPTAQFHVPEEIPTLLLQSLQSLQKDLSSGRVPHEMSSLPQSESLLSRPHPNSQGPQKAVNPPMMPAKSLDISPSWGTSVSVSSLTSDVNRGAIEAKLLSAPSVSMGTQKASVISYSSDPSSMGVLGGYSSLSAASGIEFESLKARNIYQDESLARHDQSLIELQVKVEHWERISKDMKHKIKQLEQQIKEFDGRVCNGQFYWHIHNYSKLQHEAERGETTALHSQPFYTSPSSGYKMCIRANLNGVDSARGSHLSLFIHFMQGEFDDVVDWPFSGQIIISVIDQNERCELRNHVSETLSAKPHLAAFQRPATPRNHKGFGYMEFLPLSSLRNSTYIRNDTLIIKADVKPNGKTNI